jgi:hypothetical protein
MSILERLAENSAARRAAILKQYRDLLLRGETDEDARRVLDIARELGKTDEQVRADHGVLRHAAQLAEQADGLEAVELERQRQVEQTTQTCKTLREEVKQIEQRIRESMQLQYVAESNHFKAKEASRRLAELRAANRELLGFDPAGVDASGNAAAVPPPAVAADDANPESQDGATAPQRQDAAPESTDETDKPAGTAEAGPRRSRAVRSTLELSSTEA